MGRHRVERLDASTFRVDDVTFASEVTAGVSTPERFVILKPAELIERYLDLPPGGRVVELGILDGGSTAFLALTADVERLVAFELEPSPAPALVGLIEQRDLGDVIRPYFGVDQADGERLRKIVHDEVGDAPLDLVIDDASHRLEPTRASFEALFPRVRPGGLYVIEDWAWQQVHSPAVQQSLAGAPHDEVAALLADPTSEAAAAFNDALAEALQDPTDEQAARFTAALEAALREHTVDELQERNRQVPPAPRPMGELVVELLLAVALSDEVVAKVEVDPHWVTITRGPAPLDEASFRLADVAPDPHGLLRR